MVLSYNAIESSSENPKPNTNSKPIPRVALPLNNPVVVWFGAGFAGFLACFFATATIIVAVRGC